MTAPAPRRRPPRPAAPGTLLGLVGPALAAVAVWIAAAPRAQGISVGQGRAVMFPDSGAAGGAQLLLLLILLCFAVACSVLVLWHRHPGLRRPFGVYALVGIPALACTMAAAAAGPLAATVAAPGVDAASGTVVALPPEVGPLFFGPIVMGTEVPTWTALPGWAGWFVVGAMVAAFVVAARAHLSLSPDLMDAERPDLSAGTPPGAAAPRTGP